MSGPNESIGFLNANNPIAQFKEINLEQCKLECKSHRPPLFHQHCRSYQYDTTNVFTLCNLYEIEHESSVFDPGFASGICGPGKKIYTSLPQKEIFASFFLVFSYSYYCFFFLDSFWICH